MRDEAEAGRGEGDGQTLLLVPGGGPAPGDRPQCAGPRHLPLGLQSEDLTPRVAASRQTQSGGRLETLPHTVWTSQERTRRYGESGQVSGLPADDAVSVQGENQRAGHHLRERGDRPVGGRHQEHDEIQGTAGLHGQSLSNAKF